MMTLAAIACSDLPDDPHLLRQIIGTLQGTISDQEAVLKTQAVDLQNQTLVIEKLKLHLSILRRQRFGSRSEKLGREIEQLELAIEELEVDRSPAEAPSVAARPAEKRKPVRLTLPDDLPREEQVYLPTEEEACDCCGGALHVMGEDVLEQLEYVPASFKVVRHVRPKLACRVCETIVQAPAPYHAIDRGKAGPNLLAHVLMSKYADHLPLYRQSGMYEREGLILPRSTLAGWVGQMTSLLEPLHKVLENHVMKQPSLHGDDTTVPVLSPGRGSTRTGRLWTYVADGRPWGSKIPPAVLYHYSPNRQGNHIEDHLTPFKGLLHADSYAGYDRVYRRKEQPLVAIACMAHVRRKFYDIHKAQTTAFTEQVLNLIGHLYIIEKTIRGKPPEKRKSARQQQAVPVLKALKKKLDTKYPELPRKSALAQAISYALKRWKALERYTTDGRDRDR